VSRALASAADNSDGTDVNQRLAEASTMIDLVYVLTTTLFFVLMLAYVAACARSGRTADVERATREQP
jgi:hypothetical protein